MSETVIRKVPHSEDEEHIRPIEREAAIYSILGEHPRIAQWLPNEKSNFIEIKYYPHGDLLSYARKNQDRITSELRSKWFLQIIESVDKIHKHEVIHSDLALKQFLLDDNLDARLCDFGASQCPGHVALGYEKATHCLPRDYAAPNSVRSDMFALGSTLYELVANKSPFAEIYPNESQEGAHAQSSSKFKSKLIQESQVDLEVEARYKQRLFPDVSCLFGGNIILGCWEGTVVSAEEALVQSTLLAKDVEASG